MEENSNNKACKEEGDDTMAVIAKPTKLSAIASEKSEAFIRRFNESKQDQKFIESCKEAGKLFKR